MADQSSEALAAPVVIALHHDGNQVTHLTEVGAREAAELLRHTIAHAKPGSTIDIELTPGGATRGMTAARAGVLASDIEAALSKSIAQSLGKPVGQVSHVIRDAAQEIVEVRTRYQY